MRIKYNKFIVGLLLGLFLPAIAFTIYYYLQPGNLQVIEGLSKSAFLKVHVQVISLSIYVICLPLFFLFNKLDMLKTSKGILIATIIYTALVALYYIPALFE